ncbi:MAG: ATP-binding protein [Spirochaetes bacterium]|nr:ATP-binding protein [Spirochaetota bacterium]
MPERLKIITVFKKLKISFLILLVLLASVVSFTVIAFRGVGSVREQKIAFLGIIEAPGGMPNYASQAAYEQMASALDSIQRSAAGVAGVVFVLLPLLLYSMTRTLSQGLRLYKESQMDEVRRLMFDSAPIVMTVFDKNLNILDCNKEALRRYGLKNKEAFASNFFVASPDFQPDGAASLQKGREVMQKCLEQGYLQFEWMHQTAAGEPIPSEVICFSIKHNGEDLVLAYAIDLRELKKSEKERQEAAERVQLMFENTPLFIEYWDENFDCIDSNHKAVDIYDLGHKEEYTKRWFDFFPETQKDGRPSREYWANYLKKVLDEGSAACDFIGVRGSGEPVFYDVIGYRMKLNDKNVVVTYSSDVSELKRSVKMAHDEKLRVEAAEENSRAKSRFLARMSHEIRTPIAAVLGISEIQLRSKLALEQEEAFAKIHNSANILLGIVNDLLDLSKIEAGKMTIDSDVYDAAGMLSDVVQLNLVYLGSKKIDFIVDVDERLPAKLVGDELRVKQILNNLLSNAFKYTDAGFVKLKVVALPGENLEIAISDSGHGMNEDQLEALFNEYARFHEKEMKFSKGTGLGMAITASLLELMGGKIDVQSKTGKGTCVTVKIPQKAAGEKLLGAESVTALKELRTDSKSIAKKLNFVPQAMPEGRVLVVDDVDTNLYVAKGLLAMYKVQVETCDSGIEALEKIAGGQRFDIVFMDHMMPDLDGIEATRILRERGYDAPIVALTANALIGQAEEFLKNGFDGFISKPIQVTHLDAILTKFIRDKRVTEPSVQPAAMPEVESLSDADLEAELESLGIDLSDLDSAGGNALDDFLASPEMAEKIREDFLESQRDAPSEIKQGINAGDIDTATRLAHNLKNIAGLLNDKPLAKAAAQVEAALRTLEGGGSLEQNLLDDLEREHARAYKTAAGRQF